MEEPIAKPKVGETIVADSAIDDDASHLEDDEDATGKKNGQKERRKIEIKFIENKTRRHVTFSKRKHGIMKKAFELSVLTGTQVLLLVVSETGLVYTFSTPKFEPIVTQQEGRNLIQACLNAPDEEEELEQEMEHDNDAEAGAPGPAVQQMQAPQQQVQQQQAQQQPHKAAALLGVKEDIAGQHHGRLPIPQEQYQAQQLSQQRQQQQLQQQGPRQGQYLNQDQNAVYQQYFQENQQNHY
ncbi:hypothetical protein TPHA_0N01520 [Tetrapisispora phaffii CBS 4417]|uniref:MADS-box domain-containing protein n=1 Tax=Tetrapisispora phaffii (strain ATCC 24235 / CBS 4417 / NBRC 1672 / NRRL Y-8282 / UCD 70-5) TaxID=1071381 RepID=G8C1A5_TETPH|nr:hypothetical protein TPHA_0N01520 [Tetrapisispora phaffii CBS 4417]CCE65933.1 hypothetical protein TPHA_0N01520 [Tetrapisispora phaffii CBS 4417]